MSQKPTIVFRADGSPSIGLGHLMRCLALCEILQNDFLIKFAIQNPSETVVAMLRQKVHEVIALPATNDYEEDYFNFTAFLSTDCIVVLDGYHFNEMYQKKLKTVCQKLIYIDDLSLGHQYADIIINHNGIIKKTDYQAEPYTRFFLGSEYSLLRTDFFSVLNAERKQPVSIERKRIFINLGGADPENISLYIIDVLLTGYISYDIVLIVGDANKNQHTFQKYVDTGKIVIRKSLSAKEIIEEIIQADVAIVSCSTIAYEIATLNKPFIGIVIADNQRSNAVFFQKNGIALAVLEKDFSEEEIQKALNLPTNQVATSLLNQKLFFDGKSSERLKSIFINLQTT